MRILFSSLSLLLLASVAAFPQYTVAPAAAPASLSSAVAAALDPNGIQVLNGGKVWCEVWLARTVATGPRSPEESLALPTIRHGAFLGVIRFPASAQDRRGNSVKPGLYAMRYSFYPADGNHMGAAPQRDFAILIPVEKDKAPDERLPYDALMSLSRDSTGMPHPSVLSLTSSSEEKLPSLKKEGERDWTLHVKIGDLPVAVIVAGRAEG